MLFITKIAIPKKSIWKPSILLFDLSSDKIRLLMHAHLFQRLMARLSKRISFNLTLNLNSKKILLILSRIGLIFVILSLVIMISYWVRLEIYPSWDLSSIWKRYKRWSRKDNVDFRSCMKCKVSDISGLRQ